MADCVAVEVRKWFSNDDSHHNQGDHEEAIDDGSDEVWQEVVEEENDCYGAIQYGDADL